MSQRPKSKKNQKSAPARSQEQIEQAPEEVDYDYGYHSPLIKVVKFVVVSIVSYVVGSVCLQIGSAFGVNAAQSGVRRVMESSEGQVSVDERLTQVMTTVSVGAATGLAIFLIATVLSIWAMWRLFDLCIVFARKRADLSAVNREDRKERAERRRAQKNQRRFSKSKKDEPVGDGTVENGSSEGVAA